MASYENCSPDTSLTSVATLESIFEMEQLVIRLDNAGIQWKVVEHSDIILKSFSDNIGHSTLFVEEARAKDALDILIDHRKQQLEGKECPSCTLWLGPSVNICPACHIDLTTGKKAKVNEDGEEIEETEEGFEDVDEEEVSDSERIDDLEESIDALAEGVEDLADVVENHADKLESIVNDIAEIKALLISLKEAAQKKED